MKNQKVKQISSKKYIINQGLQIIYFICFAAFGFLLGNGRTRSILDQLESSGLTKFLVLITSGIFFFLWIGKLFSAKTKHEIGEIEFLEDSLKADFNSNEYFLENMDFIKVQLNPSDFKNKFNRTIKNGGGNNWISFVYKNNPIRLEFLIESEQIENELMSLFEQWKIRKNEISIEKANRNLIDWSSI